MKNFTLLFFLIPFLAFSNFEKKLSDIETNDANFTKDTDILKWTIELKANQKSEKEFSYTVKYPKDKRINLN